MAVKKQEEVPFADGELVDGLGDCPYHAPDLAQGRSVEIVWCVGCEEAICRACYEEHRQ